MDVQADDGALVAWLRDMPKAELHLHLDGSLRPATVLELAAERAAGRHVAGLSLAALRQRLTAPPRCRDQAELLRAFELPIALLQDREALERVAGELVEDVAAEGTRHVEIRWAPSLHTAGGLPLRAGIEAVSRGARAAAARTGTSVRLIVVALRTHDPGVGAEVARVGTEGIADGVAGFDLAGDERRAPDVRDFEGAFAIARAGGLGITCHAGEAGGAGQVRAALALAPARIAHGAPAADDGALVEALRASAVTVDLCPTSNLQIGLGGDGPDAPLPRLLRAGVGVTISTDDRTVSDVTLVEELRRAVRRQGLTPVEVAGAVRHAYVAAFLQHDEGRRAELLRAFDAWLAAHPGPGETEAGRAGR